MALTAIEGVSQWGVAGCSGSRTPYVLRVILQAVAGCCSRSPLPRSCIKMQVLDNSAKDQSHGPTYIDFRPNTPCSLAWLLMVADRNSLGGGSLWYRSDCGVHSHVPARPADRQIFNYKWRACVHFCDSYPIDTLYLNFQHSLSAVTLGIYLGGWGPWPDDRQPTQQVRGVAPPLLFPLPLQVCSITCI